MRTALLLIAALLAAPALAQDSGERKPIDISKVNGAIAAEAGQRYGSLETVNGSIRIGGGAEADSAETVNGSITVEAGAKVGTLETVNGAIRIAENAVLGDYAETVNGSITLGAGSRVAGRLETVNGAITLGHAEVGGDLITVNGGINLDHSRVAGGIHVDKSGWSWFSFGSRRTPRIVVGPGSRVEGALVFEQDVELLVHESAQIGPVTGAEAKRYSGDQPD